MWSIGCILGEMYNKKPLFESEYGKLQGSKMLSVGNWEKIPWDFFSTFLAIKGSALGAVKHLTYEEFIPNAPRDAIDLLKSLLDILPYKRISAREALNHPFVKRKLFATEPYFEGFDFDEFDFVSKLNLPNAVYYNSKKYMHYLKKVRKMVRRKRNHERRLLVCESNITGLCNVPTFVDLQFLALLKRS